MNTGTRPPSPLLGGGWIQKVSQFFAREEADRYFEELYTRVEWEDRRQRLVKWFGSFDYAYTGASHRAAPLPPLLEEMRRRVEAFTFGESRGQFQGVLLNLYRDGRDSVGFHADNEPVIKPDTPIVSLSLGAERSFVLQYSRTLPVGQPLPSPITVQLAHGDCLVMGGTMQRFWKHSIPKDGRVTKPRINLTFREYNSR